MQYDIVYLQSVRGSYVNTELLMSYLHLYVAQKRCIVAHPIYIPILRDLLGNEVETYYRPLVHPVDIDHADRISQVENGPVKYHVTEYVFELGEEQLSVIVLTDPP